jgi:ribosome biogenesis ATPase
VVVVHFNSLRRQLCRHTMSGAGRGDAILESRIRAVLALGTEPTGVAVAAALKERFQSLFGRRPEVSSRACALRGAVRRRVDAQQQFLRSVVRVLQRVRDEAPEEAPGAPDADADAPAAAVAPGKLQNGATFTSDSNLLNRGLYTAPPARASKRPREAGAKSADTDDSEADSVAVKRAKEAMRRRRPRPSKSDRPPSEDEGKEGSGPPEFDGRPSVRFSDIGGIESALKAVRELVEYPLTHPEIYAHLGVDPPRGILLHGPPGCGKTLLANAIAGELGDTVSFHKVSAPELVSSQSGASERRVRELFDKAMEEAPALIFIDEIDAIAAKRDTAGSTMERRIVSQLLTCLDNLTLEATGGEAVIVVAATNRPDSLDGALRRSGRFDREIALPIPDEVARKRILERLTSKMSLAEELDLATIARSTPGYVGADLEALTKEAAVRSVHRVFRELFLQGGEPLSLLEESQLVSTRLRSWGRLSEEHLGRLAVTEEDFRYALTQVQPTATREGFATVPNVSWEDVGALEEVRDELRLAIVEPIRRPEIFEGLGLSVPAGVLLFGPPGCGKTLLAKAIANQSHANFISVKGPELLDKYVGESERAVRQVFTRARASAPCIVFFDELDALAPRRGSSSGGSGVSERVVNQLLTELDGLESRRDVYVVAATNRPDMIDPAMLRPGRLDKLLYVPLPDADGRCSILRTHLRKTPLHPSVNVESIARMSQCDRFSGADLAGLVREAAMMALRERLKESESEPPTVTVSHQHFLQALSRVRPSVSKADQKLYNAMESRLRQARSHVTASEGGESPGEPAAAGSE